MKKLYRMAGISVREILHPPGRYLCCVLEVQHRQSGALYHHHRDFPIRGTLDMLRVTLELCRIAYKGVVPADWPFLDEGPEVHSPS